MTEANHSIKNDPSSNTADADSILKCGEYIEDLQFNGLRIILSRELPSFTTDAVLLSDFARVKQSDTIADLGTGTGIIALLMYGRYAMKAVGFEIQEQLCDMASRSFILNGLHTQLRAVHMDYREAYSFYNGKFSAVVCNPPYYDSTDITSPDPSRAVTRTKVNCPINEITLSATRILKSGGKLFMCYPAAQLCDLICALREASLEPKKLRFVRSRRDKTPYIVLVEARKDGGRGITYNPDLILLNNDGTETEELRKIYHRT